MIHYEIKGIARSKKNSSRIVTVKGHPIIIPSAAYQKYEAECAQYLRDRPEQPIDYPVEVTCLYFLPRTKKGEVPKKKIDLTNLLGATLDILVKYKILADDNANIVMSVDGSRVFYVAEEPKTYITITEMNNEEDKSTYVEGG